MVNKQSKGYLRWLSHICSGLANSLQLGRSAKACLLCGKAAGGAGFPWCRDCHQRIPWIGKPVCDRCGRYEECLDCTRRRHPSFVCSRSAVRYDSLMKDLLARYKYRGDEKLAAPLSHMMGYAFERLLYELKANARDIRCIVFVPLSSERLQERGFNQAEQFALGLGRKYRIPVVPLLARTRHTDKQSYKTRAERLKDLQGAFALDHKAAAQIQIDSPSPASIILVDDVYTTGSTLNHCASIIKSGVNAHIYGLTWAR